MGNEEWEMRNECSCNFLPCFLFPVSWASIEEREEEERREQKESRNKYACNAYVTAVTLYALFFFVWWQTGSRMWVVGCSFSIWQPGGVRRGPRCRAAFFYGLLLLPKRARSSNVAKQFVKLNYSLSSSKQIDKICLSVVCMHEPPCMNLEYQQR